MTKAKRGAAPARLGWWARGAGMTFAMVVGVAPVAALF